MEYVNAEKFKAWLDEHCKFSCDLTAALAELVKQHGETGVAEYELSSWETKSGCPESFSYEYKYKIDEDGNISDTYIF